MGQHDGRRQNHRPQKHTLRGLERPTIRSPRNKEHVQRCHNLLVAEHPGRYREEGENESLRKYGPRHHHSISTGIYKPLRGTENDQNRAVPLSQKNSGMNTT